MKRSDPENKIANDLHAVLYFILILFKHFSFTNSRHFWHVTPFSHVLSLVIRTEHTVVWISESIFVLTTRSSDIKFYGCLIMDRAT